MIQCIIVTIFEKTHVEKKFFFKNDLLQKLHGAKGSHSVYVINYASFAYIVRFIQRPESPRGGLEHLVETSDKLLSTKVVKNENLTSFHVHRCN